MHIATISSQRQITIPQRMLEQLGAVKKDKLLLEVKKGQMAVKVVRGGIADQVAGSWYHLIPREKRGLPFDEIMEKTRKLAAKKLAYE